MRWCCRVVVDENVAEMRSVLRGEKIGGDRMRPAWARVTNKRRDDVDDALRSGEGAS